MAARYPNCQYIYILENHRYEVECVVVSSVIKIPVLLVDTGARYSCCHYMDVDEQLKECDVQALETNKKAGASRFIALAT